jgi:hypothetical protein
MFGLIKFIVGNTQEKLGEWALTSPQWRMNGKWSGNSFLLGFSSLANHGGYLSCFFFSPTYLLSIHKQGGC